MLETRQASDDGGHRTVAGLFVVNVSVEETDGHFLAGRDHPGCPAAHGMLVLRVKTKCFEHSGTVPVGNCPYLTSRGQSAGLELKPGCRHGTRADGGADGGVQPNHCQADNGEGMEKQTGQIRVTVGDLGPDGFQRISIVVDGIRDDELGESGSEVHASRRGGEGISKDVWLRREERESCDAAGLANSYRGSDPYSSRALAVVTATGCNPTAGLTRLQ